MGVGVASLNPTYETTRSSSFYVNIIVTVGIILGSTFVPYIVGVRYLPPLVDGALGFIAGILLLTVLPMVLIGSLLCNTGIRNLSKPDN